MVFDLLFRVGPAVKAIFELGYEPKEELFHEVTADQYKQLEKEGEYITSKAWYTILPEDQKFNVPELLIVDEEEKKDLIYAVKYINDLCKKSEECENFSDYEEKLQYVANVLPPLFSESSNYVKKKKKPHLKVAE